jgi:hypothetical protein
MPARTHELAFRHETVRIPAIGLAAALSLAIHALVLFVWLPQFEPVRLDAAGEKEGPTSLVV